MALGSATQHPVLHQQYMPEQLDQLPRRFRFSCEPAENGWILNFQDRFYVATDVDGLMDQIRTAMVVEKLK